MGVFDRIRRMEPTLKGEYKINGCWHFGSIQIQAGELSSFTLDSRWGWHVPPVSACQKLLTHRACVHWNRFRRPIATNAAISTCTLGISYGNAAAGGDWNLCEGNTLENY